MLLSIGIIIVFQAIGIAAGVLNEIRKIRKFAPKMTPTEVWATVKHEDWDTLLGSSIILVLDIAVHVVMFIKDVKPVGIMAKWWFDMAASLVLGWGGQDILFRFLGTAKQTVLEKISGGKPEQ